MIIGPEWAMLLSVVQVVFLGRALCTNELQVKRIVWYRVTRHPQVFRGLTVGQRTLGF